MLGLLGSISCTKTKDDFRLHFFFFYIAIGKSEATDVAQVTPFPFYGGGNQLRRS